MTIASGNTIFGILRASSSRWLGEISYSMYLHGLILWIIDQNILPDSALSTPRQLGLRWGDRVHPDHSFCSASYLLSKCL